MNTSSENNPLFCTPQDGACLIATPKETNDKAGLDSVHSNSSKKIKLIYFTDPICSSCWAIEPQLKKLKLEFGEHIVFDYHMGGLLPSWDIYNSGGISKPSDVASHWDEVSSYYQMPIVGDVWLQDPLSSSYPPSIAFKAAQLQDEKKAAIFLRILREKVFVEKKNITKESEIKEAADQSGLVAEKILEDMKAVALDNFQKDLQLAAKMGVRGFPTIYILGENGQMELIYGSRPYDTYVQAIQKIFPEIRRNEVTLNDLEVLDNYDSYTQKECAEILGISFEKAKFILDEWLKKNPISERIDTRNGSLWRLQRRTI
ncbi:MAG: DsbA family protein [Saprospiraceae bacterium]|jgi:putative protein-disulfide isomerase|nr:DsbA family protein [Saprospiraceae bacterium]